MTSKIEPDARDTLIIPPKRKKKRGKTYSQNYLSHNIRKEDILELNDITRRESSYTVEADLFDRVLSERMKASGEDMITEIEHRLPPPIDKVVDDLFVSAYKYVPTIKKDAEIDVEYSANRALVEKVYKMPEWKEIHRQSRGDEIISQAVAVEFMESLLRNYPREIQDIADSAQKYGDLKKEIEKMREQMNDLKQAKQSKQLTKAEKEQIRKQLQRMRKQFQKKNKQGTQAYRDMKKQIPKIANFDAMSTALCDAQQKGQKAQDMEQALGMLPGTGEGIPKHTIDKMRIRFARALQKSRDLRQIFQELGKFQYIATKKFKSKIKHSSGEITKIILDNEISNVLPSELLGLVAPELEPLFLKKYADAELIAYETKINDRLGRGPIVICIDESGSMNGDREVWSKAVALALLTLARHQRRDAHILPFSDGPIRSEFAFQYRKLSHEQHMQRMLDFADYFKDGGTSFQPPLDRAMHHIKNQDYLKNADIVFITDGEASLRDDFVEEFNKTREKLEVAMYSIIIGRSNYRERGLDRISDEVKTVEQLTESIAATLFDKI